MEVFIIKQNIMNKFIITEEEKDRILNLHKSRTSRQYLMEDEEVSSPPLVDPIKEAKRLAQAFMSGKIKIEYKNDNKEFKVIESYVENNSEIFVQVDTGPNGWLFDGDNPNIMISGEGLVQGKIIPLSIEAIDNSDGKQVVFDAVYEREGLTRKHKFSDLNDDRLDKGRGGLPIDLRFPNSEMENLPLETPYYYSVGGPG